MDFGWPAAPPSAGGACSDLNLLQDGLLIDLDDKTLQCLMGGPSAGFAACISGDVLPGEAASGSGAKRDREEEIEAADDDEDSEEGGSGGGGPATRGRGRPPKKGKHAADAASVKATREKARREKLNECFEELARLCDPGGKMVRTDRISIVQDAIRAMGALRVENNQLRQLNKFLEERVRHLETARAQGMYQQHMMQQMAMQQQQLAMAQQQQQQMQQPMAAMAPQQTGQVPAAQGGDAQQQQQQQGQAQPQPQPLAQAASGSLPAASSAGGAAAEIQTTGSAAQQPDVAQQAQQVTVAQVAPQQATAQQAQQAQQAPAVVPPGMMLVPIPAGGAPAMPAQAYPAAHPYYGMKAEGSMDASMAASGSGAVGMGGGYMMAPAGMAAGVGVAAVPAMASLPQVMPANAPPVAWLPAPDISQDGKLRPPAA